MTKHIHIHVGSRDSKWEESKHPRKDDGKFGTGKGISKQENLSPRQAALRESGSPRYAGRANSPEGDKPAAKNLVQHTKAGGDFPDVMFARPVAGKEYRGVKYAERGDIHKISRNFAEYHVSKGVLEPVPAKELNETPGLEYDGAGVQEAVEKKWEADLTAQGKARFGGNIVKVGSAGHKKELGKQAHMEHQNANRGTGSYQKAADLYTQAGMTEKAQASQALAKMYGHDAEGVAAKSQKDSAAAKAARGEASEPTTSAAHRALLREKADLLDQRAKDVESDVLTRKINAINDRLLDPKLGR